jgi:uncharacterized DUF497 family protein
MAVKGIDRRSFGSADLLISQRLALSILRKFYVKLLDADTGWQYLMQDDKFEWDDDKAASNVRDHDGITFEMARDVFDDIFAIEWVDDSHGDTEERFVILGMVENRLLYVAYTEREPRIRIISARLAEPFERRRYHNENKT